MKHSRPSTRILGTFSSLTCKSQALWASMSVRCSSVSSTWLEQMTTFHTIPMPTFQGCRRCIGGKHTGGWPRCGFAGQGLISLRNSGGGSEASVTPSYRRPESIHRCSDQVLRRERMPSNVLTALALSSFCRSRKSLRPSCSSRIALPCSTMSSIWSRTL